MMKFRIDEIIKNALMEDMNYGDLTSETLLGDHDQASALLVAKEAGVISGIDVFSRTFELVDARIKVNLEAENGQTVQEGQIIATLDGPAKGILMAERTALNILQRMSGIATMTNQYVEEIKAYSTRVVDTRKTLPGLRVLDKLAVKQGGGHNHRYNLSDAVMIKDNHIRAVGSITEAVKRAKKAIPHTTKIEVEVESLEELKEALEAKADIIMLDNMSNELMAEAVKINKGQAILEASGNVTLERLQSIAQTGVDVISVGALTHSVKAMDISLKFKI